MTVTLPPGQLAAILTLTNGGRTESPVQIRAFAWSQAADGTDRLDPTDAIAVSPPLGTIAVGRTQIVRLVQRRLPQDREATYRILVDQIPSAAQANEVRVALRLSLPVFANPHARALPNLRFGAEMAGGKLCLVATNDGKRHESIRGITLRTSNRAVLTPVAGASPYVLPGVTRRWPIADAAAASVSVSRCGCRSRPNFQASSNKGSPSTCPDSRRPSPMPGRRPAARATATLLLAVAPCPAVAADQPLLLDVLVNGHAIGKIGEFVPRDGMLLARPDGLESLGLLLPALMSAPSGVRTASWRAARARRREIISESSPRR